MNIQNDTVVTIAYTLKDDAGTVIDSSAGGDDLAYLHGHMNIVPGLENALAGKAAGDSVAVAVDPTDGYGVREERLVFQVPRDRLPDDEELSVGMQFQAQGKEGHALMVTVVEVGEQEVTLDGNHPLAGQVLHFEVDVTGVRPAEPDEIEHGHVHGPHGHHH